MESHRHGTWGLIRILVDLSTLAVAWIASFLVRFFTFFPAPLGIPSAIPYLKLLPFLGVAWLGSAYLTGLYRDFDARKSARFSEYLQALSLCMLVFIAMTYFYHELRYSRGMLLIFPVLALFLGFLGHRLVKRSWRRLRRKSRDVWVVVGPVEQVARMVHQLLADVRGTQMRFVLVFIGDLSGADAVAEEYREYVRSVHHGPPKTTWEEFLSALSPAAVYVSMSLDLKDFLVRDLPRLADQTPNLFLAPDLGPMGVYRTRIVQGIGIPLIEVDHTPWSPLDLLLKRFIDVLGAAVALILFGPLMLVIALAVKCSSRGPVLFMQERLGVRGKSFRMLKFRTMRQDAEAETGAVWARQGDPRTTWIGTVLRKTSLDELPQLWNVLVGEMSLVGPRPERPEFVQKFRLEVPGYMLRHKAKAGMTGWAQIHGWRGNTSIESRIQHDLYYVRNWSIGMDIRILILTVFKGFSHPNAY